jgi:hypothetical protein
MRFADVKTLEDLSLFIRKNPILISGSNENNKIEMIGNRLNIILNGLVDFSRVLDTESILKVARTILYLTFKISKLEYLLSPLEVDRGDEERKKIWAEIPEKITIPYFVQTYLLYVAFMGTVPTMYEFALFYKETYTREISIEEKDSRYFVYLKEIPDDRCWVGETFDFDEHTVENKLLRFREEFDIKDLPLYDFTTGQLYQRIYNNFGSISRDFCNVLTFDKNGADVYYSSKKDSEGFDMIVNGKSVATYLNTNSSNKFREDKVENRHYGLKNDIELIVSLEDKNKLTLLDDDVTLHIIKKINSLKENETTRLITDCIKKELEREAMMKSLLG